MSKNNSVKTLHCYGNECPEIGALSVELCRSLSNAKVCPLYLIYENQCPEIGACIVEAGAISGKQVQVRASMGRIEANSSKQGQVGSRAK